MRSAIQKNPEYWVWAAMKQRCLNPRSSAYRFYGARGISVCERWLSFANFFADMGTRPDKNSSLERIDNNGNYSPENCKWIPRSEQSANTRRRTFIEFRGERLRIYEWAARTGISAGLLCNRIHKLGWSIEKALTTKPDTTKALRGPGTVADAARAIGTHRNYVYYRLKKGMTLEEAILDLQLR